LSQSCGQGGKPANMQVEKEDGHLYSVARKGVRSQIPPEQRTVREFRFDQESWVKKSLKSSPPDLHARMELRKPVIHERLTPRTPLHQCLVKIGVTVERSRSGSALVGRSSTREVVMFSAAPNTGVGLGQLNTIKCRWCESRQGRKLVSPRESM